MKKQLVEEIYPITTVEYPDGTRIVTVSVEHMGAYTSPVELKKFEYWMTGQTYSEHGYYISDVQRWMDGLENDD